MALPWGSLFGVLVADIQFLINFVSVNRILYLKKDENLYRRSGIKNTLIKKTSVIRQITKYIFTFYVYKKSLQRLQEQTMDILIITL